tara:strand:- start:450 stop:1028 length:579 start_codon:yes stop_codon:yes gene_type:complete
MILWITGLSASGKSYITSGIVKNLGVGYKNNKHNVPFYSYNDIIVLARNINEKVLRGTDGVMVGKNKLKKFIDLEYSKWRHIILDGQKFLNLEILSHLIKYDLKIIYLKVPLHIINLRSKFRKNGWDENRTIKRTDNEIKKYNELLLDNSVYKKYVDIKCNDNIILGEQIITELLNELQPKPSLNLYELRLE